MKRKKTHERDIQQDVLKRLRLLGGIWYKVETAHPNSCPDIIGWYKGKSYVLEMKIPGEKPNPDQERAMLNISENGLDSVKVGTATSLEEAINFVRS